MERAGSCPEVQDSFSKRQEGLSGCLSTNQDHLSAYLEARVRKMVSIIVCCKAIRVSILPEFSHELVSNLLYSPFLD
jgi:hypothetical protein